MTTGDDGRADHIPSQDSAPEPISVKLISEPQKDETDLDIMYMSDLLTEKEIMEFENENGSQ